MDQPSRDVTPPRENGLVIDSDGFLVGGDPPYAWAHARDLSDPYDETAAFALVMAGVA